MEKRWTRKKRAAREGGGAKPNPALSDRTALSGPEAEAEDAAPPRPRKDRPEQPAPQPPVRPKARTAPEAPAQDPAPEVKAAAETPQEAITPQRPVTYRVKRIQRPRPMAQDTPAPEAPEPKPDAAQQVVPADPAEPVLAEPAPEAPAPETPAPTPQQVTEETPAPETADPMPEAIEAAPATEAEPKAQESEAKTEDAARDASAAALWNRIGKFPVDARILERNRIITATREDPVHTSFDVLRTKLLYALRENGWTRVGVTSPTEGCGKTFMTANLALSLSRQGNCRTVALDLDMRHPALARTMNLADPPAMADFLSGKLPAEDFLRRPGRNPHKIGNSVAFGFNGRREPFAAELLQEDATAEALNAMEQALAPDVILMDMPPALVNDDVLAARQLFDGIILVVGGGTTKPQQVRDVERRLGTDTPLLGVVLNKSEDDMSDTYGY